MTDVLADHASDAKKPRLEPQPTHPEGDAAAAAVGGSLVAVSVGDQIGSSDLLPALQQLLSVYQVEYWALLEELRVKRSTVSVQAATAGEDSAQAQAASAPPAGTSTMQQLWQAAHAGAGGKSTPAGAPKNLDAGAAAAQQGATQQQDTPASLTSPFAAATPAYGDQRCGYATDASQQQEQQQQQQQHPQLPVPSLAQAEQLLQQLPAGVQDAGAADQQQLQEWRQRFEAVAPSVAGLEQLASAATMQYLDAQGGLACLCGQQGRWVLRRSAASIGRSTEAKGDVDIDLGKVSGDAGVGAKVSRLQAQLLLTADGKWSLHNTGRAALTVNGQQVSRGSTVQLPHLSLLEVAGLPLLFMVNSLGVQRAVARSVQLAM